MPGREPGSTDPDGSSTPPPQRRRFVDRSGLEWLAEEVVESEGGRVLVLRSTRGEHRLTEFPADWHRRSAWALAALLPDA